MFKKFFYLFLGSVNTVLRTAKHHTSRLFTGWKAKKNELECAEHKKTNCCSHKKHY